MENIGIEWWILYGEILFLFCVMGYWLGNCFDRIVKEIKARGLETDMILQGITDINETLQKTSLQMD